MTDRALPLRREIAKYLPGASEEQLRRVLEALRGPESIPLLKSRDDLAAFTKRRFNMLDVHAVHGLWYVLVQIGYPRGELYDEAGVQYQSREVGRLTENAAGQWRLPVGLITICAQALTPYGKDPVARSVVEKLPETQKQFLREWAATFTSS